MKRHSIKIIVAILSLNLLFQVSSFAQDQKIIVVKDENDNPIPGVSVTIGEAAKPVFTNDKGEFIIKAETRTPVLLEAEGYESQIVNSTSPLGLGNVILTKFPYQLSSKDMISVPFGSLKKRMIPSAVNALDVQDILKYDQLGSFTDALNGRIPGLFGSTNIRGLGSALIVVDGIPRPATDFNMQQIEKITVLKDLSSSLLYGGQGNNGVIYITTRQGEPLKKSLHFTVTGGLNSPVSYPKFLNAADYMTLYNEALSNDGLPLKYTQDVIDNTASGSDPVRYPDQKYYNNTYLKNMSSFNSIVGEASGGNDLAQYYLNLGWSHTTGMIKLGEGNNERNDRLNMRGNISYEITKDIKLKFDGSAIFNLGNAPRYTTSGTNFWTLSSTLLPDIYPVLIPADLLKNNNNALYGAAKLIDDKYLLGGTSQYLTNIYGELTQNGPRQTNSRLVEMDFGLDFDLHYITQGLKASAYFAFDLYNVFTTDILNKYAVYKPFYQADTISSFAKYNVDTKVVDQTISDVNFYRRSGFYGTLDYHRIFGNDHEITANALAYRDQYSTETVLQPQKHLRFGIRANYMYKNKYIAELTGVVAGSVKLFETEPWGFSPAIGLGWVLTEESFLKDNSSINYLKIRANWAISNTDENLSNYYLGRNLYSSGTPYSYNQTLLGNPGRTIANGNSNIGFEKRTNINLGFESELLNYKLGMEGSYFYYKSYDVITRRANILPVYFVGLPYENFGSSQYQGFELGLNYTANVGDLVVKLGSNLTYSVPKALTIDELNYNEAYRKAQGKPTDAVFGYVALGLFKDQSDIENSPFQTFGTVYPGDIKYEDLNNDGTIDDRDQKMIGNSSARVQYSFNVSLKYKSFELFALATGQNGQDVYYNSVYYQVYGDRKYSDVVWDRWTPSTAETATYPRLSTLGGTNNYKNSTFWLYDNNWFTLHTTQLTYTPTGKIAGIDGIRFYLRGNNLVTISKTKDKSQLNIGSSPQTRVLSFGFAVML